MNIFGVRVSTRSIGAAAVAVYVCGLIGAAVGAVSHWLSGGNFPRMELWQLALAPFAIGAATIALEAAGTFLLNGFAFDETASKVRVRVGEVTFVTILTVVIIGLPMYLMSA